MDLLRHCWNKPVFAYRNHEGIAAHENLTFPKMCAKLLNLDVSTKPRKVSVESWILYLSMKEAKAFGPFLHDPAKLDEIRELSTQFHADLKQSEGYPPRINDLAFAEGFYPLRNWCEFISDCPKFKQHAYQPQWEDEATSAKTREEIAVLLKYADKHHKDASGAEVWFWKDVKWYTCWPEDFPDVDFIDKLVGELDEDDYYFARTGEEYDDNEIRGSWRNNPFGVSLCRNIVLDW